jgi:hypothetical protein
MRGQIVKCREKMIRESQGIVEHRAKRKTRRG